MGTSNTFVKSLDSDMQCWLLTACHALQTREDGCYPELEAVRRAIKEKNREVIAVGFEVACSHLADELSEQQRAMAQRLAEDIRSGSFGQIRRSVTELSKVSAQDRSIAA